MKTGFTNSFPNKPGKKHYSYHGVDRDCLIQNEPGPFDEIDTNEDPPQWEILYDRMIPNSRDWGEIYYMGDFLESSLPDLCAAGIGRRYYYAKLDLYRLVHWIRPCYYRWNDGQACVKRSVYQTVDFQHYEWFSHTLHGSYYLFEVHYAKVPSRLQIFRSTTGELPSGSP